MSDNLERVVITTPNEVAPEGHDEKMIALVDSKAVDPTRPDWLPAKFKTVEDMAASYKELEAKQGAAAPAEAPPVVSPVVAPANSLEVPTDAAAVVKSAGLDMASLSAEYANTGTLSEDSYTKLQGAGIDKATVDAYVAGQQALANQFQSDVKAATPGGAGKYAEMIEWAKANLSPEQITAYNTAVSTNNKDQAKLAVAGLGASFAASVGNEPTLQGGRTTGTQADVFESIAQMTAAMSDKRYKTDSAFRAQVQAKLGRSSIM